MVGVRLGRAFRRGAIIQFLLGAAAGDPVIFHSGKLAHPARDRPEMLQRKIEANVAIEFAISGVAGIAFVRAPDLAARIAVAGERRRAGAGVAGRVNRAMRLRGAKEQAVRVEDEPADVRLLQDGVEPRRISAFRKPKTSWVAAENIDIDISP